MNTFSFGARPSPQPQLFSAQSTKTLPARDIQLLHPCLGWCKEPLEQSISRRPMRSDHFALLDIGNRLLSCEFQDEFD
ncbi:hypothetical protein MRB53_039025 [Persea americana]|nr:hypothetical protein MRB53_039025 [Persea americana]